MIGALPPVHAWSRKNSSLSYLPRQCCIISGMASLTFSSFSLQPGNPWRSFSTAPSLSSATHRCAHGRSRNTRILLLYAIMLLDYARLPPLHRHYWTHN